MINADKIKKDFPILSRRKKLVYMDSAATSQKPKQVIKAISEYYENYNSNVHRGVYKLSEEATSRYEDSRGKIARFVGASSSEIIFTRNSTESINLVAKSLPFKKGDKIISTVMEHHSNIVPWQMLKPKIELDFFGIDRDGNLLIDENKITENTKLVTVTHSSNVLGSINNVKKIARIAHDKGVLLLVDAAQSVPHMPVNFKKMGADFAVFSGHKMLGPTGIGCLYGRKQLLEALPPFLGGGDMIKEVHLDSTVYNDVPYKFEAGTPNIEGAVGLAAAVEYLKKIGMENVHRHEKKLVKAALDSLSMKGIEIYGNAKERGGVVSFNVGDLHSHDVASMLDEDCIAVRSGHHCAQPLMERLGISSAARASFYIYNDEEDIGKLSGSLKKIMKFTEVRV